MSKRTPNLNLHVWEIPDDNNETFDYKKSIGEPLEQIDEAFGNAVSKFTEPLKYKGQVTNVSDLPSEATSGDIYSVTSLNKNYIWNGTEWVEYSSTLDLTYLENATKGSQITEEAKSLEITDCAGVNGKLSITGGETEQEQYEGKNLLNAQGLQASTENGITFTPVYKNGSLQYINVNGTATANTYYTVSTTEFEANTNYTLHGCPSGGSASKYSLFVNVVWLVDYGEGRNFTLQEAITQLVRIGIYNGTTVNNLKFYPMIEKGSTIHTYEPYVGGQASPNPDYQQDVISVGSNVNEFDKDNVKDGYFYSNQEIANSSWCYATSTRLKAGETYTTSGGRCILSYFNNNTHISYQDITNTTITIPQNTTKVYISTLKTNIDTLKLEKGPKASGYSKYGCGSVDFKVENRNIVNKSNLGIFNANGYVRTLNYTTQKGFEIKPNTDYLIISKILNNDTGVYLWDDNGNRTQATVTIVSTYQTTKSVKKFNSGNNTGLSFYMGGFETTFTDVDDFISKTELMICKKTDILPDYVEHQEQTITVPLPEGMELCKIGDYKDYPYKSGDKWYKHKEIGKIVLDGSESWIKGGNTYQFYITKPSDMISQSQLYSNYFKNQETASRNGIWAGNNLMYINNLDYTVLSDFKTWLSTHNTKVYYPCEPVEEEITDIDTLEALYKIEHLLMYEGYTTIECLNDVKPTIQAEYLYNNEINTYWGSKVDELSEMIHILEQKISEVES